MNEAIKKNWVTALRSNLYNQGTGQLYSKKNGEKTIWHCCLGVLCELYRQEHPLTSEWVDLEEVGVSFLTGKGGASPSEEVLLPPKEVVLWAGLETEDPEVAISASEVATLSFLNDGGASFEAIADMIESLEPVIAKLEPNTPKLRWKRKY